MILHTNVSKYRVFSENFPIGKETSISESLIKCDLDGTQTYTHWAGVLFSEDGNKLFPIYIVILLRQFEVFCLNYLWTFLINDLTRKSEFGITLTYIWAYWL